MTESRTPELLAEACRTVGAAIDGLAEADLAAPTPCTGFDLDQLVTHFVGTSSALARAGSTGALDPDDPWGASVERADDWRTQLQGRLAEIAQGWSDPGRWDGEIAGSPMPARGIGEMALIEVMVHGWDIARTAGRELHPSATLGRETLRCVSDTAELGRQMEAYGPAVPVADDASDFDRALGLAGRDPAWGR